MFDNHYGFSLKDLTYIFYPEQHIILVNLSGKVIYDGKWFRCNHVTDEEVIDITVFESVNYHHCICVTFKESDYVC